MRSSYEDIINLPHHRSNKHPHMPRLNRAAQFAPFAALTGYDAAVREAARVTHRRIELDEYIKAAINERLSIIQQDIKDQPYISLVYFQADHLKEGGCYLTASGSVKKIDVYEGLVVMEDGRKIVIEDIIEININKERKLCLR